MRITIDPIGYKSYLRRKKWTEKQKKFVLEEKRKIAEILLEHSFRGNDMDTSARTPGAQVASAPLKDFEMVIKTLTACNQEASQLSDRSRKLVSLYTGISEPPGDEQEKKLEVDSVVLVHVLRDAGNDLNQSLSEISDNLEKLENAW